jgi:putative tricarboxylic transport membrane protein
MGRRGDVIAGVLLFALGAGVCGRAVGLQVGTGTSPGPGFFPFLGGLTLSALAALLVAQGWQGRGDAPAGAGVAWRPAVLVAGLLVYTAAMNTAGFVLATVALAALVLLVLGARTWRVIAGVSVLLAVASYFVFKTWLGVDLPPGILAGLG